MTSTVFRHFQPKPTRTVYHGIDSDYIHCPGINANVTEAGTHAVVISANVAGGSWSVDSGANAVFGGTVQANGNLLASSNATVMGNLTVAGNTTTVTELIADSVTVTTMLTANGGNVYAGNVDVGSGVVTAGTFRLQSGDELTANMLSLSAGRLDIDEVGNGASTLYLGTTGNTGCVQLAAPLYTGGFPVLGLLNINTTGTATTTLGSTTSSTVIEGALSVGGTVTLSGATAATSSSTGALQLPTGGISAASAFLTTLTDGQALLENGELTGARQVSTENANVSSTLTVRNGAGPNAATLQVGNGTGLGASSTATWFMSSSVLEARVNGINTVAFTTTNGALALSGDVVANSFRFANGAILTAEDLGVTPGALIIDEIANGNATLQLGNAAAGTGAQVALGAPFIGCGYGMTSLGTLELAEEGSVFANTGSVQALSFTALGASGEVRVANAANGTKFVANTSTVTACVTLTVGNGTGSSGGTTLWSMTPCGALTLRTSGSNVIVLDTTGLDVTNLALQGQNVTANGPSASISLSNGTSTLFEVNSTGGVTATSFTDGSATVLSGGTLSGLTAVYANGGSVQTGTLRANGSSSASLGVGNASAINFTVSAAGAVSGTSFTDGAGGTLSGGAVSAGNVYANIGTVRGGTLTDGTASLSAGGALTGLTALSLTSGNIVGASSTSVFANSGTVRGGTLTDGTLSVSAGNITGAVRGTFSGTLTCGTLTDGTTTLTGGVLSTVMSATILQTVTAGTGVYANSGTLRGGTLTDGVATLSGGTLLTTSGNVYANSGTVKGTVLTDGSLTIQSGSLTTAAGNVYANGGTVRGEMVRGSTLTDGTATLASGTLSGALGVYANAGVVRGQTLTDGSGASMSAGSVYANTGTIQGEILTDGTASLSLGSLRGVLSVEVSGSGGGSGVYANSGTVQGATLTDGLSTLTGGSGAFSGNVTANSVVLTGSMYANSGTVQGALLSDGTLSISAGSISSAQDGVFSGNVSANSGVIRAQSVTDGTATLSGGILSGVTVHANSGLVRGNTLSDGVLSISGGSISNAINATMSGSVYANSGTVRGATLTDGSGATLSGGGAVFQSGSVYANSGTVRASTLTDGTLRCSAGSLVDAVNGAFSGVVSAQTGVYANSGVVRGGTLTDGVASLTSGSIVGGSNATFSGTVTSGTFTDGAATLLGGTLNTGETGSVFANGGIVRGGTLTDGVLVCTNGSIEDGVDGVFSGEVRAGVLIDATGTALIANGSVYANAGTMRAATLTDGVLFASGGTLSAVQNVYANAGTVRAATLTDGVTTLSNGVLSGATTLESAAVVVKASAAQLIVGTPAANNFSVNSAGNVQGVSYSDGVATLSCGQLLGATRGEFSGNVSVGAALAAVSGEFSGNVVIGATLTAACGEFTGSVSDGVLSIEGGRITGANSAVFSGTVTASSLQLTTGNVTTSSGTVSAQSLTANGANASITLGNATSTTFSVGVTGNVVATSVSDGTAVLSGGVLQNMGAVYANSGIVRGGTLTDGTAELAEGVLSSLVSLDTASATVGGSLVVTAASPSSGVLQVGNGTGLGGSGSSTWYMDASTLEARANGVNTLSFNTSSGNLGTTGTITANAFRLLSGDVLTAELLSLTAGRLDIDEISNGNAALVIGNASAGTDALVQLGAPLEACGYPLRALGTASFASNCGIYANTGTVQALTLSAAGFGASLVVSNVSGGTKFSVDTSGNTTACGTLTVGNGSGDVDTGTCRWTVEPTGVLTLKQSGVNMVVIRPTGVFANSVTVRGGTVTDGTATLSGGTLAVSNITCSTQFTDGVLTVANGSITGAQSSTFSGTVQAETITDGCLSISGGSLLNVNNVTLEGSVLAAANIQGGTLTDGVASLTAGSLSGVVNVTLSGTVTAGTLTDGVASVSNGSVYANTGLVRGSALTDGVASLSGGSLSNGVGATLSGTVRAGTLTDGAGVTISGGNVYANSGTVHGGTLTDGTASLSCGSLTGLLGIITAPTGSVFANGGTVHGGTLTDGVASLTNGAWTALRSATLSGNVTAASGTFSQTLSALQGGFTGNVVSSTGSVFANSGTIRGAALTDGALTITAGSIAGSAQSATFAGIVTGGTLSDGVASLSGGTLANAQNGVFSGNLEVGGTVEGTILSDGVLTVTGGTVSGGGNATFSGQIRGAVFTDGGGTTIAGGTVTAGTITDGAATLSNGALYANSGTVGAMTLIAGTGGVQVKNSAALTTFSVSSAGAVVLTSLSDGTLSMGGGVLSGLSNLTLGDTLRSACVHVVAAVPSANVVTIANSTGVVKCGVTGNGAVRAASLSDGVATLQQGTLSGVTFGTFSNGITVLGTGNVYANGGRVQGGVLTDGTAVLVSGELSGLGNVSGAGRLVACGACAALQVGNGTGGAATGTTAWHMAASALQACVNGAATISLLPDSGNVTIAGVMTANAFRLQSGDTLTADMLSLATGKLDIDEIANGNAALYVGNAAHGSGATVALGAPLLGCGFSMSGVGSITLVDGGSVRGSTLSAVDGSGMSTVTVSGSNGTVRAPLLCASSSITLSTDGGLTTPFLVHSTGNVTAAAMSDGVATLACGVLANVIQMTSQSVEIGGSSSAALTVCSVSGDTQVRASANGTVEAVRFSDGVGSLEQGRLTNCVLVPTVHSVELETGDPAVYSFFTANTYNLRLTPSPTPSSPSLGSVLVTNSGTVTSLQVFSNSSTPIGAVLAPSVSSPTCAVYSYTGGEWVQGSSVSRGDQMVSEGSTTITSPLVRSFTVPAVNRVYDLGTSGWTSASSGYTLSISVGSLSVANDWVVVRTGGSIGGGKLASVRLTTAAAPSVPISDAESPSVSANTSSPNMDVYVFKLGSGGFKVAVKSSTEATVSIDSSMVTLGVSDALIVTPVVPKGTFLLSAPSALSTSTQSIDVVAGGRVVFANSERLSDTNFALGPGDRGTLQWTGSLPWRVNCVPFTTVRSVALTYMTTGTGGTSVVVDTLISRTGGLVCLTLPSMRFEREGTGAGYITTSLPSDGIFWPAALTNILIVGQYKDSEDVLRYTTKTVGLTITTSGALTFAARAETDMITDYEFAANVAVLIYHTSVRWMCY